MLSQHAPHTLTTFTPTQPPTLQLATTIGLLPLQAVNTAMGTSLHSMQEILTGNKEMDAFTYGVITAQVVAGLLVTTGVLYATKVQLHRAMQEASHVEMHAHQAID